MKRKLFTIRKKTVNTQADAKEYKQLQEQNNCYDCYYIPLENGKYMVFTTIKNY